MNNQLLQALVEEDFGYRQEGRNWGRADQHSSLVVNEEEQKWYWNAEEKGGSVLDYLIQVRGLSLKSAKEILDIRGKIINGTQIKDTPREPNSQPYDKLVDLFWSLGKGNREYWYKRKITDRTIDRYMLGFYDGWSMIPLYEGDEFANFQCRRDEPSKFIMYWYKHKKKPFLINYDLLNLVDSIFITEGPVDSLLLNQEGIASVSHTGGAGYWNNEWYSYFTRTKTIYYIADNDNAGLLGAERVADSLGTDRVKIYMFDKDKPEKYDTGDYFKDGGNAKDFRQLVETNSRYSYEIGEIYERQAKRLHKIFGRNSKTYKTK